MTGSRFLISGDDGVEVTGWADRLLKVNFWVTWVLWLVVVIELS